MVLTVFEVSRVVSFLEKHALSVDDLAYVRIDRHHPSKEVIFDHLMNDFEG